MINKANNIFLLSNINHIIFINSFNEVIIMTTNQNRDRDNSTGSKNQQSHGGGKAAMETRARNEAKSKSEIASEMGRKGGQNSHKDNPKGSNEE